MTTPPNCYQMEINGKRREEFRDGILMTGDAALRLQDISPQSVDLVVTSPPYDAIRSYGGHSWNFESIAQGLIRVLRVGGVIVWVVGDSTVSGSETGTSMKQALRFVELGLRLHDTMIYEKHNPPPTGGKNRYQQAWEYMFILSKGAPKAVNLIHTPRRNACNDKRTFRMKKFTRGKDGEFGSAKPYVIRSSVPRRNIWSYKVGGGNSTKDKLPHSHPAIMPEQLALDHILTWSNKGEVVLDPFAGSGTTLKMARVSDRKFIGIEVDGGYVSIIKSRLS